MAGNKSTPPPPPPPPLQAPPIDISLGSQPPANKYVGQQAFLPKAGRKTLATASNLANLLPTGTVLAFQALIPSFANNGKCQLANKYLTLLLVVVCSIVCVISSFTDSFIGQQRDKLYYGIATFSGIYVFNRDEDDEYEEDLEKYRIKPIDFVHAFASVIVFLVFAITCSDVQTCFFEKVGENANQLIMNLPLGAGIFSSFLFMLFPTTRRGIGYADARK